MKYFMVVCSRGHMGTGHSTEIKFAIEANNLLDAQDKARRMPSVKHTRLALYGKEITYEEYTEYRQVSAYERYGETTIQQRRTSNRRNNNKRRG